MLRKLIMSSVVAATISGGAMASTAFAQPAPGSVGPVSQYQGANPPCFVSTGSNGIYAGQGTDPAGNTVFQVCAENASLPITGTVTAGGGASASGFAGYLVADGNGGNPGAAAGYIGLAGSGGTGGGDLQIVGCSQGNYDPNGYANNPGSTTGSTVANPNYPYEDNAIFDTANPQGAQNIPANLQTGACAFPAPAVP
ncbi:MAG TPA: hypothetical protein VMV14_09625 [Acidimicrobiales bacterium]|nr:hypothetical protein [Acidimicrobiales bacterium]